MYFSEQGNVDDDATFITVFLVSFNLQSWCLMQSANVKNRVNIMKLQNNYLFYFPKICQILPLATCFKNILRLICH